MCAVAAMTYVAAANFLALLLRRADAPTVDMQAAKQPAGSGRRTIVVGIA
jgi:hypothetical protein